MSRIEEALRRARAVTPAAPFGTSTDDAERSPRETPSRGDEFESPWTFETTSVRAAHVDGAAAAVLPHPRARATGPVADALEAFGREPIGVGSMAPEPASAEPAGAAQTGAAPTGPGAIASASPSGAPMPDPGRRRHALFSGFDPVEEPRIVGSREVPPESVEEYRRLGATLHHLQADRGIRIVMVTSAVPGEGKSLTSTNLALTLSQSYRRRVLLIDGDLRRPSIHQIFRLQNPVGLSEALKAEDERKLSIVEVSDQLSILTAGKPDPDPMGGLTSDRMRRIIQEAASKFDWVIIDTPPVALMPDAGLLAAMAEAAILVIGAARTPHDVVQRTVDSLGRDKIVGVVLNRAEDTGAFGGKQYQSYYHD